jgi:hypothetical protein
MRVQLGNRHPIGVDHPSITLVVLPDEPPPNLLDITDPGGIWANQSHDPRPAWIEADNAEFAQRLAEHYGSPIGRPDDWKDTP